MAYDLSLRKQTNQLQLLNIKIKKDNDRLSRNVSSQSMNPTNFDVQGTW